MFILLAALACAAAPSSLADCDRYERGYAKEA